jgi:glycosyltransferase involved in cell wall biosynthesis
VDPIRPVLGFVWDAVRALAAAPDLELEVIMPVPLRAAQSAQAIVRRLRGKQAWPEGHEQKLAALDPKPTLVPYVPIFRRSIESATIAIAAQLLLRPADRRPRVIQGSFIDEAGFVAASVARVIGASSIAVAHGTDVRAARGKLRDGGGRRRRALQTIRSATKILAVSHHLAQELALLGAHADVLRFTTTAARFPEAPIARHNPRTILFAGRIARDKGVDVLLEAFARLRHTETKLKLVGALAGDIDPLKEAARLAIMSRVTVEREVPQDALFRHYADASCVVLPSRTEGYGIVLVESLLVGRPVIGADTGGIREIIDDPAVGRLAPAGDPFALAEAIDRVLDGLDRGEYPPHRLRARALPLTWETVGPKLCAIVRRLASRGAT